MPKQWYDTDYGDLRDPINYATFNRAYRAQREEERANPAFSEGWLRARRAIEQMEESKKRADELHGQRLPGVSDMLSGRPASGTANRPDVPQIHVVAASEAPRAGQDAAGSAASTAGGGLQVPGQWQGQRQGQGSSQGR